MGSRLLRDSEYGANILGYIRRKVSTEEREFITHPHYDVGDILYVRETWKEYEKVCVRETCHTERFLSVSEQMTDIATSGIGITWVAPLNPYAQRSRPNLARSDRCES